MTPRNLLDRVARIRHAAELLDIVLHDVDGFDDATTTVAVEGFKGALRILDQLLPESPYRELVTELDLDGDVERRIDALRAGPIQFSLDLHERPDNVVPIFGRRPTDPPPTTPGAS